MRPEANSALSGLKYSPPRKETILRGSSRAVQLALYFSTGVVVTIMVTTALSQERAAGFSSFAGVAFVAVVIGILLVLTRLTMIVRAPSIENGVMSLPVPIRRIGGGVSRSIVLAEIVDVEPSFGTDRSDGVDIRLSDDTEFFLPRSSFVGSGMKVMEDLCLAFGKSFRESMRKFADRGYSLLVVSPLRMRGSAVALSRPLLTYSDTIARSLAPGDVARIRTVQSETPHAPYEFELRDGTFLLMRVDEVERVGLTKSPEWSTKFKGP